MQLRPVWLLGALLVALTVACTAGGVRPEATPRVEPTIGVSRTATAPASATPQPVRMDIRASRLTIPSLDIDSEVQASQIIPSTSTPPPGCPARPEGEETLSVPDQGVATPEPQLEGLENKAWIFSHSRWLNQPGVFMKLQDIGTGDEIFLDGVDRTTGRPIPRRRFVVDGIYLTDLDSGESLITATDPAEIPAEPIVILQTSVREDGANRQWLLDRQKVMTMSRNLIEGDVHDPCKYLLLFVVARAS